MSGGSDDTGRSSAPSSARYGQSFLQARLALARLEDGDAERLELILERATKLIAEQLDVQRVGIWLFDESSTTLTQVLLYDRTTQQHTRPGSVLETKNCPAYFSAINELRALVIDDTRTHPATASMVDDYIAPLDISSMLDAPIFRHGKLFGIVCHENVGPARRWKPYEVDFAASVADMIALYFEGAEAAHAQKLLMTRENELLQAERHASVGILARHVAHDLNNAVAPILMCAAQLRTALAGDARLLERVQIILDAAQHGVGIARRLLNAAAGGPLTNRDPIDIDAFLVDAIPLLTAVAGEDVEVIVETSSNHASIPADPIELMRALINLVTNARDAMPHGGRLSIKTRPGDFGVCLEVSDSGMGMTPEEQGNLFQPFYTTKPGRGSGLGLAGVRTMVEAVRGKVDVVSAPGAGTTVTITFPSALSIDEEL